jgi:phospholipid-transporting ATPase
MKDDETELKAECRNSDLIEELGQVEFVFSDKTGTLTQNKMDFKWCSVDGKVFIDSEDGSSQLEGDKMELKENCWWTITNWGISACSGNQTENALIDFFTFMAVCHSVVVDKDPETGELLYQASSPDELALVNASKNAGIELVGRSKNDIIIQVGDWTDNYTILKEFPFDSDRKRMSCVAQYDNGRYELLTKGADNIMAPRINWDSEEQKNAIEGELYDFAVEGLRTLVMGKKDLTA